MRVAWPYARWRYHRLAKRLWRVVCRQLYRDTDRDIRKSIMVAGTARSGTTWLANIIASQIPCRIMFEPFHCRKVEAFRQFHYFQYMRPTERNDDLWSYCQTIFTGNIRNRWIDREIDQLYPQYRIIKEIRANLFLIWLQAAFPEIPILFMIRHPCAVVLSRMQLAWATDTDIQSFLSQPELVNDFLQDKMDVIRCAQTAEEKHAVIWCVHNLIPLRQCKSGGLNIVFYENLCRRPEVEIARIFRIIQHPYRDGVFQMIGEPSTTTMRASAIMTGSDKVTRWQKELSPEQIRNILSVVEAFGLGGLYGTSPIPLTTDFHEPLHHNGGV